MTLKKFASVTLIILTGIACTAMLQAENNIPHNTAVVNFKDCIEQSLYGQQEQNTFESARKQMVENYEKKEAEFKEMGAKLNNAEYLDGLSNEAVEELNNNYRAKNQEIIQYRSQLYDTMNQMNMLFLQKMKDAITLASGTVANKKGYSIILPEDSCFFCSPDINATSEVIEEMNTAFEAEKNAKK